MSVALLTSLVLALVWTSNLSTRLIRRGQKAEPPRAVPHDSTTPFRPGSTNDPQAAQIAADDGGRRSVAHAAARSAVSLRAYEGSCGVR